MSQPHETIIIVGAGIVGSALAHFLSSSSPSSPTTPRTITLIDRSFGPLLGSTGHAPGFVGQFNESPVLTKLAIDSVSEYTKIPGGFDTVGGLEIAFQPAGCERLKARCATASQRGLAAEILSLREAHTLAPELVRQEESPGSGAAVFFPTDGTADACRITSFYQDSAKKAGVEFLQTSVEKLLLTPDGRIKGVQVLDLGSAQQLEADKVILTTGIWARDLCRDLPFPVPVIPVGHPYMHARTRTPLPPRESAKSKSESLPFVRWPEHHVYARDHGTRYGIGSYDHPPVGCAPNAQDGTAIGVWIPDFRQTLEAARKMLPTATAAEFEEDASENQTKSRSFNGIFSMTPDNMPLAGAVRSVPGLHMAVAVWVTHAAGTAKFLTGLLNGNGVDQETLGALEPERFAGRDFATLEEESLCGYNSIYKTVAK
ncbi:FAD dependent oxidoreductase [Colletotrichum scovillei]|uniref:Sarcosine oxidase n=1 Tax=Colletotrichum scovillei TaxID=1209932 RepID=A0A9P7UHT2_9PEZI|nr:FAD dependent oxidoreductase [Colletotrichum scovillei]KAF4777208.1 FAD dependent oxidoreductase [Colletotrichum scovillei]KAG7053842.1 sarcosine oxidase [Colletotrichum scovillei]KAG7072136.1 sarcosine oxidase [Colletotrichum scovillei]KAG7080445.1 sarcosine oxidase [Colletotrichum scovillei]